MNADETVRGLRYTQKKYENKVILTGETDVSTMCRESADLIESLQAQLAASQREKRAAVEDMKIIADAYREKTCDDGICGLCKFDADHGLDGYANECPGFGRDDCFAWRGPVAGKGDADRV